MGYHLRGCDRCLKSEYNEKWSLAAKSMESLLPRNVLELSISERIQLVQDIWDSIAIASEEVEITDSQKQELFRRLELYAENRDRFSKWEDFKQKFK
ncbi:MULTISPECIES: addiction module protein [Spirulina sp. CCY15215]|uniref:addiction module protein n=1 Tax=Spirulina sp. CCY15215 TaxID=2767591 RepID=UPI00195231C8